MPANALTVSLTFNNIDIENNNDFLYVYDGNSAAAPLLASFTGYSYYLNPIVSSGSEMFVRFVTNSSIRFWL